MVRLDENGQTQQPVQGPNSDHLKFSPSLCQLCNNQRSQAFDLAYQQMMEYLSSHESDILASGSFQQSEIYGTSWVSGRDNAVRYLVKHIGCRLAEDGVEVPSSFVGFLNASEPEPVGLELVLHVSLDIVEAERHLADSHNIEPGSLWMGRSTATLSQDSRSITSVSSHVGVGPFRFSYEVLLDGQRPCMTNLASDEVLVSTFRNMPPGSILENCNECIRSSDVLDGGCSDDH
jgi:hypothetical protein